jgi:hypothetical protein
LPSRALESAGRGVHLDCTPFTAALRLEAAVAQFLRALETAVFLLYKDAHALDAPK